MKYRPKTNRKDMLYTHPVPMFSLHLWMKHTTMTNRAPAMITEISSSARLPAKDVADLKCSAVGDDDEAPLLTIARPLRTLFLLLAASRSCVSLPLVFWASVFSSCRLSTPSTVVRGGLCLLVTGGGGDDVEVSLSLAPRREEGEAGGGLVALGPSGGGIYLSLASATQTLAHHTHRATERQALALCRAIITGGKNELEGGTRGRVEVVFSSWFLKTLFTRHGTPPPLT